MNLLEQLSSMIADEAKEIGVDLKATGPELALAIAQTTEVIAPLSESPEFPALVRRAANAVAVQAGVVVTEKARFADGKIVGMVMNALFIVAGAPAGTMIR